MNAQKQFNTEFKIKSLSLEFGLHTEVLATVNDYAAAVEYGHATANNGTWGRVTSNANDARLYLENNPIYMNCDPGTADYWQHLADLLHNIYNENDADNAYIALEEARDNSNKEADRANTAAEEAEEIINNPGRRHSSTLEKLEEESQRAHDMAEYMWEDASSYKDAADRLTEAAEDMAELVAKVDTMAELMTEWDQYEETKAAEALAKIQTVTRSTADTHHADPIRSAACSTPRDIIPVPESQKNDHPAEVPADLLEQYTGTGCTLGRCHNTKYIQNVRVTSQWGTIKFLYRGGRRGAFDEVKKQFPGYIDALAQGNKLILYYTPDQPAELIATVEEFEAEALTRAAINWHIRRNTFPTLPLALPAVGTPDPQPEASDILAAGIESGHVLICSIPSQSKTATPSPVKKSVNWDELTEEERHPMPAFYTDLRDLARSHNQECAATYRLAAEIIDDSLTKNPDAWRDFIPGMFLNLDDCGLKMDGANHIGAAISEMVYSDQPKDWNNGKSGITPRLCMIEKIIDCTDEDLQLFEYNNDLPEGCALGGGRCDDDEAQARALARMREKYIMPKEREAAEQKYYSYFFTLVTMYRSTNYCVFIDAEGYSWCRYLLFLPSWRTMYAADVQAAVEKDQRRQEEAAADRLIEETNALLKYNADCDRLRPYMVADLSALQLNDRQSRQNGRRRNILSALRHFFPGQKFSVKYRWSSHDEIEITWTDGPTQEEVENCCNWSIFCDTWRHFDGMTDSTSTGDRKFTNFAQQYGGGYLNKISFDRYYSEARSEAAKATARDILAAHGIAPDSGAHQTADEYPAIWNDIANRYGRHVADWLHNWSWLDTYAISRAILANNADRPAA